MTCREKLKLEHPDYVKDLNSTRYAGGCLDCPDDYKYLETPEYCGEGVFKDTCTKCWDREIPGTESIHVELLNIKKENETMEKKTKAQLIEEINAHMNTIHELKQDIEKLEKYRQYEDAANEMYAIYEATVNAGFTKEQAWELFMTTLKVAPQMMG